MTEREIVPACMICGSEHFDATDSEKEFDGNGGEWWSFWTYCKACDCWTEHFEHESQETE